MKMRVVVFDRELHEALTVVEVPAWLAERAKDGVPIHFAPRAVFDPHEVPNAINATFKQITLWFETVRRGRSGEVLFWYAYADDPELALLLRAAFLPGQVGEVQHREKVAWLRGALSTLA